MEKIFIGVPFALDIDVEEGYTLENNVVAYLHHPSSGLSFRAETTDQDEHSAHVLFNTDEFKAGSYALEVYEVSTDGDVLSMLYYQRDYGVGIEVSVSSPDV